MNIGSWPARRIFWVSLLWELTLSAVIVLHVTNMFVSVGSTGSGGVGASADVGELLAMLFLIIAAPPIFIGVWVVQGNHGLVKGLKILFAVVLSFVLAGQIRRALDATRLRAAIFQAVEGGDAKMPSRELAQRPGSETEANEIASI